MKIKDTKCQNCKAVNLHIHKNPIYLECGSCGWIQMRETPVEVQVRPQHYIGYLKNTLKHLCEAAVESPSDMFEEGDGHYELLNQIEKVGRYATPSKTNVKRNREASFFVDMNDGARLDITITKH